MPTLGITILKNNVPWGPFTREQIDDGIARGDFTLKYLAHAPGLKEWHPLGEVLDHVERQSAPRVPPLPPVPAETPDLPPVPVAVAPAFVAPAPPTEARPPVLPPPATPPPLLSQAGRKPEVAPESEPEIPLTPASFFRRGVAILIDSAVLFVPLGILWVIWALSIEIPAKWHPISHQARMDEWDFLKLTMGRLFWLDMIGFGWFYGAGMESSACQATIGKKWAGIVVTDLRGHRVSFVRATGRYAAKYLSALPCFLGFIMALFSSRNLTLHDRLSETRVVRKEGNAPWPR